jgi:hypothetical protein
MCSSLLLTKSSRPTDPLKRASFLTRPRYLTSSTQCGVSPAGGLIARPSTFHAQPLSGPKAIASGAAILGQLQALKYKDDRRNFTFDKYVQLHMQQHNLHADLADYGNAPLSENLKILWFKEGITDRSFEVVKMNVIASPERYATF